MTRAAGCVAGALVGTLSGVLLWDLLSARTALGAVAWVLPLALAYAALGMSFGRRPEPAPVVLVGQQALSVLPGHPLPTRAVAQVPRPRTGALTAG